MKRAVPFILLLVLVAVVATGACLLTRYLIPTMRPLDPGSAHYSIHEQLGITPEQEKALAPIEARYAKRREQLIQTIQQANTELANVMMADKGASPRVTAVIEKIHAAQGELQLITIAHVFEMKAVLTPEQGDRLLELTAQALKSETGVSR